MEASAQHGEGFAQGVVGDVVPSIVMEMACDRVCPFAFLRCLFDPGGAIDHIGEQMLHQTGA